MKAAVAHLPQLDAVRGIACLLVLFAHLKAIQLLHWIPEVLGVAGVGIFFVLSGFLITRILIVDRAEGSGLLDFYNRRVARIFPIYYLTLAVVGIFWSGNELLWAANFSFNFQFLASSRDYYASEIAATRVPPVAHFWSLCVEEHFYWFWPLAMLLLPRAMVRHIPAVIIAATPGITYAISRYLTESGFSQEETRGLVSRLTVTQLAGISLGALAAFYESWLSKVQLELGRMPLRRSVLVGTGILLAAAVWAGIAPELPREVRRACAGTLLHLICGGLFLIALSNRRLGQIDWLRSVGKISYGLYLYHLPVYAALGLTSAKAEAEWQVGLLAVAATFALAAASFHLVEQPIMQWVRQWRDSPAPARTHSRAYLGAVLTVAVLAMFIINLSQSFRSAFPDAPGETLASAPGRGVTETREAQSSALLKESVRTIVVGSSHGELGFASPECAELTYNLSNESQDLWYDCEIVKAVVPKLPNLKRVVFCVSAFSFRYSISDTDSERWREALYYHACGIRARTDHQGDRKYSRLVLTNSANRIARLRSKIEFGDEAQRGWKPRASQEFDRQSGAVAAQRHQQSRGNRVHENRALLIRTIQMCQARGLECVIVSTPTHAIYRQHLAEEYVAEANSLREQVCVETGAAYVDYTADPRFVDSDFFDGDHLSEIGARKFTRIFEEDSVLRSVHFDKAGSSQPRLR